MGSTLDDYAQFISQLPAEDSSEVFGLHPNVTTITGIREGSELLNTVLSLQPRTGSAGSGIRSRDEVVLGVTHEIAEGLPEDFDLEFALEKYPPVYKDSMNSVLVQELARFNKLLKRVRTTLRDLGRAITGKVVMSPELDRMCESMYNERVPSLWSDVAYPSLKSLSAWVADLKARVVMFTAWLEDGAPAVFWISGFFFTQSFLTGTLQNYARASKVPIDELVFDFAVVSDVAVDSLEPALLGCYIHGLFLEGARWDRFAGVLEEPLHRQLFDPMPVIWLKPTPSADLEDQASSYSCPVYKTSKRAGVLSTTGRSTNFILAITLPCTRTDSHWVKRGVALLTQMD